MPSVAYGTRTIEFEVLRKPRMKNTYIQVTADGVLVKTNKRTSMKEIDEFVVKKSAWIVKHLEKLKAKKIEKKIVTGSRIYYMGKSYYLEIQMESEALASNTKARLKPSVPSCSGLKFTHSKFVIKAQKGVTQEELAWIIDRFYKQKAIEKISPLVEKWSKEMSLTPNYVGYRKAKTRWGSCSFRDRISFNYHLMRLPMHLVEYVVVHELAHIKHKNHSRDFWSFVEKYLPDYKLRESKIKVFEKLF